eukprot:CAMPEP_0203877952 /NCGR_PEP_ID=MMETSP0359-20131031/22515_1 /ASSEMBLY_ACC=CAM_ASM_000338 /TAXON_ID=268821 /ORGANISM="Scrippsiella Hangoei, Strain SHTV-5" /LENGTH=1254 /DNA_ID=CAMNT_0050797015 /DNA_START=52 /DNA_END=3816 /DNA_ORIENTATION=-
MTGAEILVQEPHASTPGGAVASGEPAPQEGRARKLLLRKTGSTPLKMAPKPRATAGTRDDEEAIVKGAPAEAEAGAECSSPAAGDEAAVSPPVMASKKRTRPPLVKHRLAGKTPKGLTGRIAQLVSARTVDTAADLPGPALAECLLALTGPPNVARSAARVRLLLRWLQKRARHGAARVCGRVVTSAHIKEASELVGNIWSPKLVRLQQLKGKPKVRALKRKDTIASAKGAEREDIDMVVVSTTQGRVLRRMDTVGSTPDADPAAGPLPSSRVLRRSDTECSALSVATFPSPDNVSDEESADEGSDLSEEEDVDCESEEPVESSPVELVEPEEEQLLDDGYLGDWSGAPALGSPDFNAFAVDAMRAAGVARSFPLAGAESASECPPLQPHQEAAIFLLHPKSPVTRLLVDHPTGSGKTREMIHVLDNFFNDSRPKVPVFPKEPVCRNFYAELLRWPSKYRDYFCCLRPHCAARAAGSVAWRALRDHIWDIGSLSDKELQAICKEMREVLEMKGCFYMGRMRKAWKDDFKCRFPNDPLPAAPLRALRYTSAGGRHTHLRDDGLPASSLFKIGFCKEDPNVYSNKIVLMDEVHNLVRTQTQFGEQLTNLRTLLFGAKGVVLAGFTGTPILNEPQEGRQLLDIIKGIGAPVGDAGFLSSFPMRPRSLFPQSLPRGIPDSVLTPKLRRQFIKKVALDGEALQRYDRKRSTALPLRSLQRYCNLCVHFGSMHDGKHGSKARVLDSFDTCAPKLHAIACDVAAEPSKAVVLVARTSGMDAFLEHLRRLAAPAGCEQPLFGIATMDELSAFNSPANLRGELFRVLVADATSCSEGVSFFGVRRLLLADVPSSPSALVQAVGRAIRMYGHRGLPANEWTVSTTMYAATMPRWLQSRLGTWAYRAQKHHHDPQVAKAKARNLVRKLIKVGIHSLEVLKAKLSSHFPQPAKASPRAEEANTLETEVPLLQESDIQGSSPPQVPGSDADMNVDSARTGALPADTSAPARQLEAVEVARFLESIGLWDEARLMDSSRQNQANKAKRVLRRNTSTESMRSLQRNASTESQVGDTGAQDDKSAHHFLRALQWLMEVDEVSQLVERMRFETRTADEEALRALAAASRELMPALRVLRSEAIDRQVLEHLIGQQGDDLADVGEASEGESSAGDFGVSGESAGEETGPAPLVLPAGWQTNKVKRGKQVVREFLDPSGRRYKTEAQARAAIDAQRRSANLANRFRERFQARISASDAGEVPAEKRPRLADGQ